MDFKITDLRHFSLKIDYFSEITLIIDFAKIVDFLLKIPRSRNLKIHGIEPIISDPLLLRSLTLAANTKSLNVKGVTYLLIRNILRNLFNRIT